MRPAAARFSAALPALCAALAPARAGVGPMAAPATLAAGMGRFLIVHPIRGTGDHGLAGIYATGAAQVTALGLLSVLFLIALICRPPEPAVLLFHNPREAPPGARRALALGVAVSTLHLGFLVLAALGFLRAAVAVPLVAMPFAFAMPFANALAWRRGWWTDGFRLYYAALSLAAVTFVGLLADLNWLAWR